MAVWSLDLSGVSCRLIPFADSDVRHNSFPVVNLALIVLNGLVFLYQLGIGGVGTLFGGDSVGLTQFFFTWGFIPAELSQGQFFTQLSTGQGALSNETPVPTWGTIFSSMFIHGGLLHLAGNMAFLWVFGDNIEDDLGHFKYLLFYLGAGVAATLTHFFMDPTSQTPLVGASGAVSGVMGAYLISYPHNRIKALVIFFIITVVNVSAVVLLGLWFLWQLIQAALSLGVSDQVSVAFGAHVGGFVAGVLVVAVYKLFTGKPIWPPRGGSPGGGGSTRYWRGRPID